MKQRKNGAPSGIRANRRAALIVDLLLKEMQRGVRDQQLLESLQWERLFGAKQSVVVNLQKLVQTLAVLPGEEEQHSSVAANREEPPLSTAEMAMLTAWLAERN